MAATLTHSERPDWLQTGEDDKSPTKGPMSWTQANTEGSDDEGNAVVFGRGRDLEANNRASGNGNDDDDKPERSRCAKCSVTIVSALFIAFFAVAAWLMERDNRLNFLQRRVFYIASGVVPLMFLTQYYCCFSAPVIYSLATSMAVWSGVLIALDAIQVTNTLEEPESDRDDDELQDATRALIGSSIGCVSALYHILLVYCC